MSDVVDPLVLLAPRICTADILAALHRGDRAGARSRITSSFHGSSGGEVAFQVDGKVIRWASGGQRGEVRVAALVDYAASMLTPETGEVIIRCYADYTAAATSGFVQGGPTYAKDREWHDERYQEYREASRALHDAADAVWREKPVGQQIGLF